MGKFLGSLEVRVPLADRGERTLLSPIRYRSDSGEFFTVPAGTTTDYASVPRALWVILAPTGRHTYPAVLHDYLYRSGAVPRRQADGLFLEALQSVGVWFGRRWLMWAGVRLFGRRSYRGGARA